MLLVARGPPRTPPASSTADPPLPPKAEHKSVCEKEIQWLGEREVALYCVRLSVHLTQAGSASPGTERSFPTSATKEAFYLKNPKNDACVRPLTTLTLATK